ncbi:hypothetical protein [Arthrobacter sp. KNU40]|uniref:hypothetical protein n=1 Tax=Arthrobacter sp. KNU40 TaxID=3447965 RepID=UPI003F5F8D28
MKVVLGLSQSQLENILGKPEGVQTFPALAGDPASTYFDYPSKGIQIFFEAPSYKAKRIFFYNSCPTNSNFPVSFPYGTSKGINWSSSMTDVVWTYKNPLFDSATKGRLSTTRRFDYGTIDFMFESDKLCRISVGTQAQ